MLLVGLPLAAATLFVIERLAAAQRAAQEYAMIASTRALTAAVDGEIEKHAAAGYALATSRALATGDYAGFHGQAQAALQHLPHSWLLLVGADGQQIFNTLRPFGASLPKIRPMEIHRRALETRERQVSDIFDGTIAQRPIAAIYVPAVIGGVPKYSIVLGLDPKNFLRMLQQQPVPDGWLTGIIDRGGKFVARSVDHDRWVGHLASPGWRAALQKGKEGLFESLSVEGEPLYSAYMNSEISGWSISFGASRAVLNAPLRQSLWLTGLSAAFLIALSMGLAYLGARPIVNAMSSLAAASSSLLQGRHRPVSRTGLSDVDQALDAFDTASDAILVREKRQQVLVDELNHRVKNTLAVVQSIATVSSKSATSVAQFCDSLVHRIIAMARTHDVLTATHWEGVPLRQIFVSEMDAFRSEGAERAELSGEEVMLNPKAAISLSMAVHELATNSAKYGALSVPAGRIRISWRLLDEGTPRQLQIDWKEVGGPVVGTPTRQGYGAKLIVLTLEYDLKGSAQIRYRPEGLHCVLQFPLAPVEVALRG